VHLCAFACAFATVQSYVSVNVWLQRVAIPPTFDSTDYTNLFALFFGCGRWGRMRIESSTREPIPTPTFHEASKDVRASEVHRRGSLEAAARVDKVLSCTANLALKPAKTPESRSVLQCIGDFFSGIGAAIATVIARAFLSATSAVQEFLGVEPRGEPVPKRVRELARKVFGDSIDFSKVRVKWGSAGILGASERPFANGNTIYMKSVPRAGSDAKLLHELTHVWQHQNESSNTLGRAALLQVGGSLTGTTNDLYDWKEAVAQGLPFERMNPESQAELIQDAFESGYFNSPEICRTFAQNGVDYTPVLKRALRQISGDESP
jgi:hypothetical protein